MRKLSFSLATVMIILMTTLTSCEAIGGIFKAGMWWAFLLMFIVVALVIWVVMKARK